MWKKAEKFLSQDKFIKPLIKKHGPCRIKPSKKKDYFKNLVYAIVGQQLSMKAAASIYARVEEKLDKNVIPDKVLRKHTETLRKCGLSYSKIKYIKDLSLKVKNKEVKLNKIDKLSDEEILEELISVKGIGKWTAEMFLMFSLARPDVFPIDDLGIRNGMKKLLKREMNPEAMVKFAERWQPFRSVASWYVWRSLENN